jgi:hypothetical protein
MFQILQKNADLIKSTEINFLMHNYYLLESSVLGRIYNLNFYEIKVHDRPLNL